MLVALGDGLAEVDVERGRGACHATAEAATTCPDVPLK